MKTEAKKKTRLSTVPEAALEEAGLAKETILAAIPIDGVVTQEIQDIIGSEIVKEEVCV